MLQCASCSHVTVWTQVCTAPMTQFPHIWLRSWQTQGHRAREQLHTAVQQPPPGTASINTWLTDTLKCRWRSGYCCRVLAAEDYHQLSLSYPTDSTWHRYQLQCHKLLSNACFQSVVCYNCRQTQQDGQITEHASLAQSELKWTTGSAVEWLDYIM